MIPAETSKWNAVRKNSEERQLTSSSPTIGTLLAISPEEVVIQPQALENPAALETRIHFPRVGFVVRPVSQPSL